ncbi:STAS domain-containing protein [Spirillospora sp. NPDC048819]|uniref:STAS domain-containing protein n=1 Tax=Spirillospora sp. NPDC048819 TaxID=3155268 RepID=UPI0033CDADE8
MSDALTSVFGIEPGDHAYVRYAGEDERRRLRAAHVTAAAVRGERAVFVDAVARDGHDARALPGGGQVIVLTPGEAGFAGGRLDVPRLIRVLDAQAADAARLGLRGLRMCVDVAGVLAGAPEAAAADVGRPGRCPLTVLRDRPRPPAVICHGDRLRLPEAVLPALAERHPLTLDAATALARHPLLCVRPVRDPAGLCLEGEIDDSNIGLLTRALETAPLDGRDLRLYVRGLRFADVRAVRLLAHAAEAMPDGHRLVLHAPGPVIRAVLRLYAWDRRIVVEEGDRG